MSTALRRRLAHLKLALARGAPPVVTPAEGDEARRRITERLDRRERAAADGDTVAAAHLARIVAYLAERIEARP